MRILERYFSLELVSRENLEKINIQEGGEGVLLEGNLGELLNLVILEDTLMELKGTNGVLRLNVNREELSEAIKREESTEK